MGVLPGEFYQKPAVKVAKELLGKVLVRELEGGERKAGMVVETEAYCGPDDAACHSSAGRTERTEVMFGPAGRAYVYLVYGMHYMFNIVTEAPGEAVLIRALDPLVVGCALKGANISEVAKFTSRSGKKRRLKPATPEGIATFTARSDREIAAGPGKLTKWLDIDKNFNGWDLTRGEKLWVSNGGGVKAAAGKTRPDKSGRLGNAAVEKSLSQGKFEIVSAKRIGVDYAGEWAEKPLRFYIKGHPSVSK